MEDFKNVMAPYPKFKVGDRVTKPDAEGNGTVVETETHGNGSWGVVVLWDSDGFKANYSNHPELVLVDPLSDFQYALQHVGESCESTNTMNKRIEELAVQADEEMDQEAFSEDMYIPAEWIQKFAELIVKECVGFFENINDRKDAVAMLKVHFGVKYDR